MVIMQHPRLEKVRQVRTILEMPGIIQVPLAVLLNQGLFSNNSSSISAKDNVDGMSLLSTGEGKYSIIVKL
jgi:hypothetical protein